MIINCPKCGYPVKVKDDSRIFSHSLSRGLVKALLKAVKLARRKSRAYNVPIRLSEGGLNHFELANFQKLKYFNGLVLKGKIEGQYKRGYWLITKQGRDFVRGIYKVPKRVKTLDGKVIWKDSRLIGIKDFMKYFDEYWQKSFPAEVAGDFVKQQSLL